MIYLILFITDKNNNCNILICKFAILSLFLKFTVKISSRLPGAVKKNNNCQKLQRNLCSVKLTHTPILKMGGCIGSNRDNTIPGELLCLIRCKTFANIKDTIAVYSHVLCFGFSAV